MQYQVKAQKAAQHALETCVYIVLKPNDLKNDSVEAIRPMRTETIVIVVGKLRAGVGWHYLQW